MDKAQTEASMPPMVVKHELLRGITAQLDELFQLGSRLTGLNSSTKRGRSRIELASPMQENASAVLKRRSKSRAKPRHLMRGS
ncbi:MAG: hypothetical protein QM706_03210 [Nitrospira sp.]